MNTQVTSILPVPRGAMWYSLAGSMGRGSAIGVELAAFRNSGGGGVDVACGISDELRIWDASGATSVGGLGARVRSSGAQQLFRFSPSGSVVLAPRRSGARTTAGDGCRPSTPLTNTISRTPSLELCFPEQ